MWTFATFFAAVCLLHSLFVWLHFYVIFAEEFLNCSSFDHLIIQSHSSSKDL